MGRPLLWRSDGTDAGPALALVRLESYGMLIIVGLIVLDPQIMVIDTITHTSADRIAGSMLTTATSLETGILR